MKFKQLHFLIQQVGTVANVDGGLLLVSGDHPHLDTGLHQVGDGLWYTVLQTILDRTTAQQFEVTFHTITDLGHRIITTVDQRLSGLKLLLEDAHLLLADLLACEQQCAQTIHREGLQIFHRLAHVLTLLLALQQALLHDVIGTLAVEHVTTVRQAHEHRHASALRGERQLTEHLVEDLLTEQTHPTAVRVALQKHRLIVTRTVTESLLIGRRRLVLHLAVLRDIAHHTVTHGHGQ
mmetsp:Transcript_23132/g.57898  ORF Transcript_23132/g.57898 Transcript_23132/m.57898 type:complete len:236 (-) Transcript_23132:1024-1731(-)